MNRSARKEKPEEKEREGAGDKAERRPSVEMTSQAAVERMWSEREANLGLNFYAGTQGLWVQLFIWVGYCITLTRWEGE